MPRSVASSREGLPAGIRIEPLSAATIRGAILVKNAGWRETYAAHLGAEYLDRMDARVQQTVEVWAAGLEQGKLLPTWVALDGESAVIGVAAGGPAEVVDAVPGRLAGERAEGPTHELSVLYVASQWRGTGVAEALAETVLEGHPATLWVLEDNPRARAFYSKIGFVADGVTEALPAEWNGAREARMVRS